MQSVFLDQNSDLVNYKTSWFIILILSAVRLEVKSDTCYGAIIDEKNILAAAVCTQGKEAEDFTVWVGDYKSSSDAETDHAVCGLTQQPPLLERFWEERNKELVPEDKKDVTMLHLCEPITFSKGKFYILIVLKINMFSLSRC